MTTWLSPATAADRAGCHVVTIWRALESGELHGHQRTKGARWRIHPEAVDAWIRGRDTADACGCSRVTSLQRGAAA